MGRIIIPRMDRRTTRVLSLLAGIFATLSSQPARAQLPPCIEKKLPYPTLAQELLSDKAGQPVSGVVVGDLRLEGDIHDREAVRRRILGKFKGQEFESEAALVDNVEEIGIRGDFQDHGYFEVEVTAEARPLDIKDQKQRFLVIAHVTEGDQFRVGYLSFQNADPDRALALPKKQLYDQISLRPGDVLNVDQIRLGVERMTKLYGSFGYMDFTAEPDFDVDHINHRISVVFKLSEQRQYRVESIDVSGLNRKTENALRAKIRVNELYDNKAIEEIFEKFKATLPPGSTPENSLQVYRNIQRATVSLHFVFVNCPT
jgi:hypothetical protein